MAPYVGLPYAADPGGDGMHDRWLGAIEADHAAHQQRREGRDHQQHQHLEQQEGPRGAAEGLPAVFHGA